ncbi:MAG: regulatory protein RecX [Salinivirgaceae bacterium]|nr:regulatory protein RecX [Salinivirgaceae bacterium]
MEKQHYLSKAMAYCSKAEHCVSDLNQKMMQWEVPESFRDDIIAALMEENFINEERYAAAFVNDKIKFNRWGRKKVRYALRQKQVPASFIDYALGNVNLDEYKSILQQVLGSKCEEKNSDDPRFREKVVRALLTKGFEYDLISECYDKITDNQR